MPLGCRKMLDSQTVSFTSLSKTLAKIDASVSQVGLWMRCVEQASTLPAERSAASLPVSVSSTHCLAGLAPSLDVV